MKTYLKLIGPSIDKGIDALEKKLNELKKLDKQHLYGDIIYHAISKLVPSYDVLTGQLVKEGTELLGEYDFVVEWAHVPTLEQVRGLIRQVDDALLYTGCRYMITTK
jgi:hypothetical protein